MFNAFINKNIPTIFLVGIFLCLPVVDFSQNNQIIDHGAVYKFKRKWYKHNMVYGSLLLNDNDIQNVENVDGDTVSFPIDSVRRYYLPEQITLYKNGRYQYATGKIQNISMGVSDMHVNIDYVYGYRLNKYLEVGIGTGMDHNSFLFHTSSDIHFVNIVGAPLFIQSRYNLYHKRKCLYIKGKVGMTNNSEAGNIIRMNNGLLLEGGVGMRLPSRLRTRFYFEFSQYVSHAKGAANIPSPDILSDVEFDAWFYRFLFTFGVEFGK